MTEPDVADSIVRLRETLSTMSGRLRQAGCAPAVLSCHQMLLLTDRLAAQLALPVATMHAAAAPKPTSWWQSLKNLLGVDTCEPTDKTGAKVNVHGEIVESNGNVIHCSGATKATCSNGLWVCSI